MSCGVGPYWHFRLDGSIQRTEQDFSSALTDWARHAVKVKAASMLSPSEMVFLIRSAPAFVQEAFSEKMLDESWAGFNEYSQWPLCWACNSISEYIRSSGGGYPHLTSEDAWGARCRQDRQARGLPEPRRPGPDATVDSLLAGVFSAPTKSNA